MIYVFLAAGFISIVFLHIHRRHVREQKKLMEDMHAYLDFMRQQKVEQLYGRTSVYDVLDDKGTKQKK